MATFTYIPSYGSPNSNTARTNIAQFGDGYMQRSQDGINSLVREWKLEFRGRDATEADAIEAFLIARGGHESFDWTPPNGSAGKWIVADGSWTRSRTSGPHSTISCTFREVFGE